MCVFCCLLFVCFKKRHILLFENKWKVSYRLTSLSWSPPLIEQNCPKEVGLSTLRIVRNCRTVSPIVFYNILYACLGTNYFWTFSCAINSSQIKQTGVHWRSVRLRLKPTSTCKHRPEFCCQTLHQNYTSVLLIMAILLFNFLQMFLKE